MASELLAAGRASPDRLEQDGAHQRRHDARTGTRTCWQTPRMLRSMCWSGAVLVSKMVSKTTRLTTLLWC